MPETLGEMHMYDVVKIDTIVFKIVGGRVPLKPPPPQDFQQSEISGSNRVNLAQFT